MSLLDSIGSSIFQNKNLSYNFILTTSKFEKQLCMPTITPTDNPTISVLVDKVWDWVHTTLYTLLPLNNTKHSIETPILRCTFLHKILEK